MDSGYVQLRNKVNMMLNTWHVDWEYLRYVLDMPDKIFESHKDVLETLQGEELQSLAKLSREEYDALPEVEKCMFCFSVLGKVDRGLMLSVLSRCFSHQG
jgi:hypothetical protein